MKFKKLQCDSTEYLTNIQSGEMKLEEANKNCRICLSLI